MQTNAAPRLPVPVVCRIFFSNVRGLSGKPYLVNPARGRVGTVTECGVRGLGFKSPGSILTSRTETSSLSRVVRDCWDPCSVPVSV